jgi:hypothetical protein
LILILQVFTGKPNNPFETKKDGGALNTPPSILHNIGFEPCFRTD